MWNKIEEKMVNLRNLRSNKTNVVSLKMFYNFLKLC